MQIEPSIAQRLDAFFFPTDGQDEIFRPPTFDTFLRSAGTNILLR